VAGERGEGEGIQSHCSGLDMWQGIRSHFKGLDMGLRIRSPSHWIGYAV